MDTLNSPIRTETFEGVNEAHCRFLGWLSASADAGLPWALPATDPQGFAENAAVPYLGSGRHLMVEVTDEAIGRWSTRGSWSLYLRPGISQVEILDALGYWLAPGIAPEYGDMAHCGASHRLILDHLGDDVARDYWAAVLLA